MRNTGELFDLAGREGVRVWFTRLAPAYAGLYIRKPGLPSSIAALDLHRHERLLRAVLAEELGHHFTTAGEWVKAASSTRERVALSRTEQRALRWAEDFLMRDPEFAWCWRRCRDAGEGADYFWVPQRLVVGKMARMAAQGTASA